MDRYALFDVIATGGMASVHLGRLIGPVGFSRTVAIKRLHENFARDPEFVAMFLDEARLVARIRHPNVVQTLDVVACAEELLVVMEYVAGESLALLIKRAHGSGRLTPIPVVVDVLTGVLNGLHAAHEATNEKGEPLNVVHRDVSPHNILVGTDGVTRVLDFGIAKAAGHFHHSREGQVKGKIRYMPPEQIRGSDVTRAADIFAASVVLWEALTCSRLHGAGNDGEIVYRVLEGKIPRPSQLRRDVPRALDEIVARGLHADPAQRYQTAKEMADALERVAVPVTRNTISKWVLESAPNEIQRREESLARVEGTMTPITASVAPAAFAPADAATGDSTLSQMGSLSQSLSPAGARWSRGKRFALAAGVAFAIAAAALTPAILRKSSESATQPNSLPASHLAESRNAQAQAQKAPEPGVAAAEGASTTPAASATPSADAVPASPSAEPTAVSASSSATRKRAGPTTTVKRTRTKDGPFDRIYKRE